MIHKYPVFVEEYKSAQIFTAACSTQTELVATVHTFTYSLRHTVQFPLRLEIAGAEAELLNLSPVTHIPISALHKLSHATRIQ